MIDTKNKILIAGLILIFGSCIEPVSDDLWSVMIEKECGTSGYARDVHVENDIAYVAAGEGGAEIWDLSSGSGPTLLNAISLDDIGARKEISKIHYSSINNLLHLLEINERSYVFLLDETSFNIQSPYGQYGAEDTRDFVVIDSADHFTYYSVIKKDHFLKWQRWVKTIFGDIFFWGDSQEPAIGSELDVGAVPTSLTASGNYIIIGVGQLGIQIWRLIQLELDPVFVAAIDLKGAVESVNLIDDSALYVSRGTDGATYISLSDLNLNDPSSPFLNDPTAVHFADDLNVDHIAVKNDVAALSLGTKGIALYDVSDPDNPIERGIFPVGYAYKSEFWGESLVVCTREGLKIINIER